MAEPIKHLPVSSLNRSGQVKHYWIPLFMVKGLPSTSAFKSSETQFLKDTSSDGQGIDALIIATRGTNVLNYLVALYPYLNCSAQFCVYSQFSEVRKLRFFSTDFLAFGRLHGVVKKWKCSSAYASHWDLAKRAPSFTHAYPSHYANEWSKRLCSLWNKGAHQLRSRILPCWPTPNRLRTAIKKSKIAIN